MAADRLRLGLHLCQPPTVGADGKDLVRLHLEHLVAASRLDSLVEVARRGPVVGFDVVELLPQPGDHAWGVRADVEIFPRYKATVNIKEHAERMRQLIQSELGETC